MDCNIANGSKNVKTCSSRAKTTACSPMSVSNLLDSMDRLISPCKGPSVN